MTAQEKTLIRKSTFLLLSTLLLAAGGCVVGPKYVAPVTQAPPAYKEAQLSPDGTLWTPATPREATLRGDWWELYQEPELKALEAQLNTANQNIAQSFQNFMAARAVVKQARAPYFPTVTVGPSYARGRTSGNVTGQIPGLNLNSNNFELPFDVSWEPDVFGRVRNTVRESANAAQVSAADLANVRLGEQANLAAYNFELRGQDALLGLYQQTVAAYQENLKLAEVRSRTGVDTEQAVAEADLSLKTAVAAETNLRVAAPSTSTPLRCWSGSLPRPSQRPCAPSPQRCRPSRSACPRSCSSVGPTSPPPSEPWPRRMR